MISKANKTWIMIISDFHYLQRKVNEFLSKCSDKIEVLDIKPMSDHEIMLVCRTLDDDEENV